ncbi:MAG: hypothetical protein FVQ82_16310 [Planctomycetes bacterium]|nr:hypothetical protein [Planctomycetota bacterium]
MKLDTKSRKSYYDANEKLENYVRMYYREQLSNGALQLYLFGIPRLEREQSGHCRQITANYQTLGRAAFKSPTGIRKLLDELNSVLCEIVIGKPIKDGKCATVLRRYTLAELKENKRKSKIVSNKPHHATELSEILESRTFVYGDKQSCKPYWNIARTGRVISHKPNVQSDSKRDRIENLRQGLDSGYLLFDFDLKQADPSIIQHLISYRFDSDPYKKLSTITGITRAEAKHEVNKLAYCKSAVAVLKYWTPEARATFLPYAERLDTYKQLLWINGKPKGRKRRHTETMGGTRIVADRGSRVHKGQLLCWQVQGTVADIINTACIEFFKREQSEGWRLLFPEHDGVYVAGLPEQEDKLRDVIIKTAQKLGLNLSVDVKAYPVPKAQLQTKHTGIRQAS